MDVKIDLLKNRKLGKGKKGKDVVKTSLILSLISYLIIVISIFAYSQVLNFQVQNRDTEITNHSLQIEKLQDVELMTVLLADKSSSLKEIVANKKRHHDIANYLFTILPPGVSIQGFSITKSNQLQFSGVANSLKSLKIFLDNIKVKQSSLIVISKVNVAGLSQKLGLSQSGNEEQIEYSFSINLEFL